MKLDLSNQNVLITGGSRGIGAACSRFFAHSGANVLVHYRSNRDAAKSILASLETAQGRNHLMFAADLGDSDPCSRLFEFIEQEWGRLDVLVNNAGIWVENPIGELSEDALETTWKINTRAVFLCVSKALPLLNGPNSNIVNLSSTAGQRGESGYSPYAATKGALIASTKSWASELAPRIRVNAVAPGWVDTDMCEAPFSGGGRQAIESSIPLQRVASPDDIAGAVLFLASPLARHITGEVLNVNGGSVLCG
jgi:3-oxoacyl-[acyl-carrier protein] reductase